MSYKEELVYWCGSCATKRQRFVTTDIKQIGRHCEQPHHQCKCGRWFVRIDRHLHTWEKGNPDGHQEIGIAKGDLKFALENVWVNDPPPPEKPAPVERVPWVGFRCWRVYPGQPVLMPLNATSDVSEWMPGRGTFTATCRTHSHACPASSCKCGFWGLNDLWEAIGRNPPSGNGILFHYQIIKEDLGAPIESRPILVAGVLEMSGRMIRGSDGARADTAKILALWPVTNMLTDPTVQRRVMDTLAKLYKVEVASTWEYLVLMADERRVMYAAADAVEPSQVTR